MKWLSTTSLILETIVSIIPIEMPNELKHAIAPLGITSQSARFCAFSFASIRLLCYNCHFTVNRRWFGGGKDSISYEVELHYR